jgi:hypothetical protein
MNNKKKQHSNSNSSEDISEEEKPIESPQKRVCEFFLQFIFSIKDGVWS